jgi:hypothetical protein
VLIDPFWFGQYHPKVTAPLSPPLESKGEPFLSIQSFGPFVIDPVTLAQQQGVQTGGAILPPLFSQLPQAESDLCII